MHAGGLARTLGGAPKGAANRIEEFFARLPFWFRFSFMAICPISLRLYPSYYEPKTERFEQLNWVSVGSWLWPLSCCLFSPLSAFLPAHLIDFVFDPLAEPFRHCHKPRPLDSMS